MVSRSGRRVLAWLVCLSIPACAVGELNVGQPDTGGGADAARDVGTDTLSDARSDAARDAIVDARTDAARESGADATTDARQDAGADVRVDAAFDTLSESGPDATADAIDGASPDAAPDVGPDVLPPADAAQESGACGDGPACTGAARACCDGRCVDTSTAIDHCGSCGHACGLPPNAMARCNAGACVLSCDGSHANCNGSYADGCEVDVRRDPANCGGCGMPARTETRNGMDDDCDGSIDEGFSLDGRSLACTGAYRAMTIPDSEIDDYGATSGGDGVEVYCFAGSYRFCLTGEACPWRAGAPATDDGRTCSSAGLTAPTYPMAYHISSYFTTVLPSLGAPSADRIECPPPGNARFALGRP